MIKKTKWKYTYFISYITKNRQCGMMEMFTSNTINSFDDLLEIKDTIDRKNNDSCIILNYKYLNRKKVND